MAGVVLEPDYPIQPILFYDSKDNQGKKQLCPKISVVHNNTRSLNSNCWTSCYENISPCPMKIFLQLCLLLTRVTEHWWSRGIFSCLEFSTLKYLQSFEPQSAVGYWWIADVCGYRMPRGLYPPHAHFSSSPHLKHSDLVSRRSCHDKSRGTHRRC